MTIHIEEEHAHSLTEYGRIPIAFTVRVRYRVRAADPGADREWHLDEEMVDPPYAKDYDALEGEGPSRWGKRWDLRRWGVLTARDDEARVGGAVVAWHTKGLDMLEGREDLAVLWDLRVARSARRRGIGRALVERAAAWARARGCRQLKVETQDVNVPACRLYAATGFTLRDVVPGAYPACPDETQLIWIREVVS